MKPVSDSLKRIYTRKMCTDIEDFDFAISECKRIADLYGWTPALRRRLASLGRGLEALKSVTDLQGDILEQIKTMPRNEASHNFLCKRMSMPSIAVFAACLSLMKKGIIRTRSEGNRYSPTVYVLVK